MCPFWLCCLLNFSRLLQEWLTQLGFQFWWEPSSALWPFKMDPYLIGGPATCCHLWKQNLQPIPSGNRIWTSACRRGTKTIMQKENVIAWGSLLQTQSRVLQSSQQGEMKLAGKCTLQSTEMFSFKCTSSVPAVPGQGMTDSAHTSLQQGRQLPRPRELNPGASQQWMRQENQQPPGPEKEGVGLLQHRRHQRNYKHS